MVSGTGSVRRMRRIAVRRPAVQKSVSCTETLVTLHLEPPLTRILAPGFFAPSSSSTSGRRVRRRVKIAAASPAAPAPMMATSQVEGNPVARG